MPTPSDDDVDLAALRRRRSVKWRGYPPDVLPLWVAETDFELAEPVRAVLADMVARSDTGYGHPGELPEAFAELAARRWGLAVEPARVLVMPDVTRGVIAALEVLTAPGDAVVIETPAYPPFWWAVRHSGRRVVEVPYLERAGAWAPDVAGVEAALSAGAGALLLCSPHNPTGVVHSGDHLGALADLAERHGAAVLADEVHGLLVQPSVEFVPFGSIAASRPGLTAVTMTSASKAWNVAGLKTALLIAHTAATWDRLGDVPEEYGASVFGVAAGVAAFRDGEPWLDAALTRIGRAQQVLADALVAQLPAVRWTPPPSTYLAWLDCRGLGLGDDPAAVFMERGRVALSPGPEFGPPGRGFARLNLGTGPNVIRDAVARMARSLPSPPAPAR